MYVQPGTQVVIEDGSKGFFMYFHNKYSKDCSILLKDISQIIHTSLDKIYYIKESNLESEDIENTYKDTVILDAYNDDLWMEKLRKLDLNYCISTDNSLKIESWYHALLENKIKTCIVINEDELKMLYISKDTKEEAERIFVDYFENSCVFCGTGIKEGSLCKTCRDNVES